MIKTTKTMLAASIVAASILTTFDKPTFAEEIIPSSNTFTTVGELPPTNEVTNQPIIMTDVKSLKAKMEETHYTIQKGDSLKKIAESYDLDVKTLMTWNNLLTEVLFAGDSISINGQIELTGEEKVEFEKAKAEQEALKAKIAQEQALALQKKKEQEQATQKQQQEQQAKAEAEKAAKQQQTQQQTQKQSTNNNVIAIANQYLGVPYVFGGTTPSGFDCSGYVSYVFKQAGKLNSHYNAAGLYSISQKVSTPQVGDLVFFSGTYKPGISHVGIYIGDNKMINASGKKVQISNIYDAYWGKHFTGFGRI